MSKYINHKLCSKLIDQLICATKCYPKMLLNLMKTLFVVFSRDIVQPTLENIPTTTRTGLFHFILFELILFISGIFEYFDSSTLSQVGNLYDVYFEICFRAQISVTKRGLNCEPLTCNLVTKPFELQGLTF